MRVALAKKEFEYYKRMADIKDATNEGIILKLQNGGPMTRRCMIAELARREGAVVVRKR